MAFRTKLDFSSNRQVRQSIETFTELSGGTKFGVPYNMLPSGPNLTTTGETFDAVSVISLFSGNNTTTNFTWFYPEMQDAEYLLSAITPTTSAATQEVGPVFKPTNTTIIDGNTVNLEYSGISYDLYVDNIVDLGGGNYSGTVQSDELFFYSASTLDFTGRTIWADVSGITRTQKLIVTDSPQIGYVLTCVDSEGMAKWEAVSAVTSATTLWLVGSGNFSLYANNDSGLDATGNYALAEGFATTASGVGSHAEGFATTASGDNSHAEGSRTIASGLVSHAEGSGTLASGFNSHAEGNSTQATGNYSHGEGSTTFAIGIASHAEGVLTQANADFSHAEGERTIASGDSSHAEGKSTQAGGNYSHAGGSGSKANGFVSFVHGVNSEASGDNSVILGGDNHQINSGATSAVVVGGQNNFIDTNGIQSAIIGGRDNVINSGVTRSVILGGIGITGTTSDTTYVDQLNIKTVGSTAFLNDIRIDANGNLTTNTSDERLKENINPITNALDKVKQLQGVTYQWKDRNAGGDKVKLGFIAQQVEEVEPLLVFTNNDESQYKGLHIDGIIPLLVESIKEITNGSTIYLETQTILAEDNNIDLNFNGNQQSAINGGIRVLHAKGIDQSAELTIDSNGDWVTNNKFKPNSLVIPNYTPTSSNDEFGDIGDMVSDENYIYIKTNMGWKRANLETF